EEILTRKAQEGVEVRLQIDDLANLTRRKFYRRMQKKGVQVKSFLRVRLLLLNSDTNYRNHRKNVVIDGRVGYTGGMNIAKRYAVGIRSGIWRDTHIRVTGPVVSEMQSAFLMDWKFTTKQLLDDPAYYPAVPPAGNLLMQVATSGPMGEFRVIMQAVLRILAESKHYVYIQTPYFIPTEPIMLALRNAALSGVDVRLMVPYRGDGNFLVTLASRSYVKDLLAAGVKVIFYEKGFLHAKTIVADDQVVSIGSTNMDVRSFEQDFEINAFIYDSDMAVRMRDVFLEDEKDGRYIDPAQWAERPAFVRFEESFARLFSPLL
ncbi:MAG: cardiolipin synthase, partial [Bacteroidales bacterium]|nr:cardiolipin synthase [Bacteroidales bacterium]